MADTHADSSEQQDTATHRYRDRACGDGGESYRVAADDNDDGRRRGASEEQQQGFSRSLSLSLIRSEASLCSVIAALQIMVGSPGYVTRSLPLLRAEFLRRPTRIRYRMEHAL